MESLSKIPHTISFVKCSDTPEKKYILIGNICEDISLNVKFPDTTISSKHRLIIDGEDDSSLEVIDGVCTR